MNERLLDIACCPVTHQDLRKADSGVLAELNQRIENGDLVTIGGHPITRPFEAGLITHNGRRFYPVYDGLVALLEVESVLLEDDA
ncbi:MAG: Trm112 family protein [Pseudomonadota bacterium]